MKIMVRLVEASQEQEAFAQLLLDEDSTCGFSHTRSDALGEDERCYVILVDEDVVGFYSYRWVSSQIFYFFIAPRWRKKGVGSLALALLLESLRELGVLHATVNMEPGSELFWDRALDGFDVRNEWGSRFRIYIGKTP